MLYNARGFGNYETRCISLLPGLQIQFVFHLSHRTDIGYSKENLKMHTRRSSPPIPLPPALCPPAPRGSFRILWRGVAGSTLLPSPFPFLPSSPLLSLPFPHPKSQLPTLPYLIPYPCPIPSAPLPLPLLTGVRGITPGKNFWIYRCS